VVLVVQALPFLSAVALAVLEASRANDFGAWRALQGRMAGLLPQRGAIIEAPVPVEQRVEQTP
jgi:hypothetical protein